MFESGTEGWYVKVEYGGASRMSMSRNFTEGDTDIVDDCVVRNKNTRQWPFDSSILV